MIISDAAKILGVSGEVTKADIKKAFRLASSKYHPDKGGSHEMMQAVNAAWDCLKDFEGSLDSGEKTGDLKYSDQLNDAINSVINLEGVIVEVCGSWVWLHGRTKQHKEKLGKNGAGFFYAMKKKAWYFRPKDWTSSGRGNWSLDKIRENHGSHVVSKSNSKKSLTA